MGPDGYGKVRIEGEDALKQLQISESLAIAATGAERFVVPALRVARAIGESFGSRCADLDGGMVDFLARLVKHVPDKLPDLPVVPLVIVILSKNSLTGRVTCTFLVSGCEPQRFGPPPGREVGTVILAPRRETSDLIKHRMDAVLPEIFKETNNANFRAKIEAAVKLAVIDAAKSDEQININVRFAFIGES
jgi:hypothetical protein